MKTDWNNVATWYDEYLKGDDTYQAKVIAPNLLRLLNPKKGMHLLDVACGQGYFSRLCAQTGATVVGVDQSKQLIETAEAQKGEMETYTVGNAERLQELQLGTFDAAYVVLALENIKNIDSVLGGMKIALNKNGKAVLVMLHPSFRIPKYSNWGYDMKQGVQYRKVEKYLSEVSIPIELHPFKGKNEKTVTFHRPLQWYMKAFRKHGFGITNIEEWISHKKSEAGPRQKAEDAARKEVPMFLALELSIFDNK